jgi:predicted secreted protein
MQIGSIIAIYFLFFVASAFILLPVGVRTDEEVGAQKVPGQADSAPHRFDLKRHLLRAALLALVLFGLFYANWHYGWIGPEDLDFYNPR